MVQCKGFIYMEIWRKRFQKRAKNEVLREWFSISESYSNPKVFSLYIHWIVVVTRLNPLTQKRMCFAQQSVPFLSSDTDVNHTDKTQTTGMLIHILFLDKFRCEVLSSFRMTCRSLWRQCASPQTVTSSRATPRGPSWCGHLTMTTSSGLTGRPPMPWSLPTR